MRKNLQKISLYLVVALFVFLPFSSWLVGLSGSSSVSLLRDIFVLMLALLVIFSFQRPMKMSSVVLLTLAFLLYGIATFFWREASSMQWLKGFRFTFIPIIMYISLSQITFSDLQKKAIYKVIFVGGILVFVLAVLEFFGVKLPLSSSFSDPGSIEVTHYVGDSSTIRLQSVLAGPNALGLYLLAILAFTFGVFENIIKKYRWISLFFIFLIILTYSRSAMIGAFLVLIILLIQYLRSKVGRLRTAIIVCSTVVLISLIGIFAYQNPRVQNLLTHGESSSMRFDQYKRIWSQKDEIGLFGRGSGTAGPSSQLRLDSGENHWTENIYLDLFEELGLVGLFIYLGIITLLIIKAAQVSDRNQRTTLLTILISFSISGIFINYYTGQVGLYLMWLAAGLLLNEEQK